ncbi:MAG TPA: hypothetical protein VKS78_06280 [Roseiarcus sp.]|nr:hypothetical protein [Roseiarcus sp.]
MSRAAAWNIRGVGRETRDAAQEAARRAGMSLSEWLDDVIAEHAVEQGVDPEDFDRDDRLDAIAERLSHLERRDSQPRRRRLDDEDEEPPPRKLVSRDEMKRADELLEEAIERFESRAAESEKRTARALDSIAERIESNHTGADRRALESVAERLQSLETRIATQQEKAASSAARPPAPDSANALAARELDDRLNRLAQRMDAAEKRREEAQRQRPRLDLAEAVSQIARRRQALDAGQSRAPKDLSSGAGWRNFGVDVAPPTPPSPAEGARQDAADVAAADLRADLQRLSLRLEEMGREQAQGRTTPIADVASLRGELAAMSQALADLAPRNAVVAIEGAVRDLSERVAALRDRDLRDSLAKPVDEIVAGIRETLRAHDPHEAVANLDRDIRAIGAKIDTLAESRVDPDAFERIRRQTEEVRNMLSAAATRPMPVDRLEKQIGELADRVDRLAMSRSPSVDSARVVASLAEAQEQIERSTPAAALNLIERRLEGIGAKIDQALVRAQSASAISPRAVEELARRIESVRETIETRHPLPIVSASLEATMRELSAKLQETETKRFDPESLEAWMRELSAKLEAARPVALDTTQLERWMRELTDRLSPAQNGRVDSGSLESWMHEVSAKLETARPVALDTAPLEKWMRELTDKLDKPAPSSADSATLESLIRGLADKVDRARGGETDPKALAALQSQVSKIDERLARADSDLSTVGSIGRMVAQLSTQLDETRAALRMAAANGPSDDSGLAARQIDTLRATQEASERRVQSTLSGVHGMLEKLVDRMARIEDDVTRADRSASVETIAAEPPALVKPVQAPPVEAPKRDAGPPPISLADRSGARANGGADFLIEPGAGGPPREPDAASAPAKAAINAHIAAARRAAQAASAETSAAAGADKGATDEPHAASRGGIAQARAFLNARRRPILLGLAFVILGAIAVIELGALFQSNTQKSELAVPPAKTASEPAPQKTEARVIDSTPTGAIGSSAVPAPSIPEHRAPVPAPADLVALIPSSVPQTLHDLAASGDPAAEYELASRLADGRSIPRDLHAASQWFERAARQNFGPAQYRLGGLYEKGNGVERDLALAKAWYQKAADAGNIRAMHNLAVLAADGSSAKPDYAEAFMWFRKAAQYGVKDSQYNLAILYARGIGTPQDLNQSWLWFSLAAQQGDQDAGKKRDEVALKLDANALAADGATLAAFHAREPDPAANDVKAPEGGWDAKAPSQATDALHKPQHGTPL